MISRPALFASTIALAVVTGAVYLWVERGYLILIDLANNGINAFCL